MSWNFSFFLCMISCFTGAACVLKWMISSQLYRQNMKLSLQENQSNSEKRAQKKSFKNTILIPSWIQYSSSIFPIVLSIFILRSFIVEPFRIPSGSMLPTLHPGDLILVNKFSYGIRLPILEKKVVSFRQIKRGDVVVFHYPLNPKVDYIKRIVGVPGDEISYIDKKLYINGKGMTYKQVGINPKKDVVEYAVQYSQEISKIGHGVLLENSMSQEIVPMWQFPHSSNCQYACNGMRCQVPPEHYFTMGDNRDNSADSRYWGFVLEKNIIGKAFYIWMNFTDLNRIGRFE